MTETVESGTINGIEYEVFDLTRLNSPDFVGGFYFSAGSTEGEPVAMSEGLTIETIALEGPYATLYLAVEAAVAFIMELDKPNKPNEPIDYAAKCKRRRDDGPTPCLCCPDECAG